MVAKLDISALPVVELESLSRQHPESSVVQSAFLLALFRNQDDRFADQLQVAALSGLDRSHLFDLIYKDTLDKQVAEVHETYFPEEAEEPQEDLTALQEQLDKQVMAHAARQEFRTQLENKAEEIRETEQPEVGKSEFGVEKKSFTGWIRSLESKRRSNLLDEELIRKFIDTAPSMDRSRQTFFKAEEMGKLSLVEDDSFVTETMADLYAKQGYIDKAIHAYEKLSENYPEKSDYFARRIEEIKENQG